MKKAQVTVTCEDMEQYRSALETQRDMRDEGHATIFHLHNDLFQAARKVHAAQTMCDRRH